MHSVYFVNIYEITYCKYSLIFIWSKQQEKLYNIEIEKYITLFEIGEFQNGTLCANHMQTLYSKTIT